MKLQGQSLADESVFFVILEALDLPSGSRSPSAHLPPAKSPESPQFMHTVRPTERTPGPQSLRTPVHLEFPRGGVKAGVAVLVEASGA